MWAILGVFLAMSGVEEATPEFLYKILSPAAWQLSQGRDRLELGPDDATFIHLAEAHQVERIAAKFFADQPEVVVIQLDPRRLPGRLVKEANPGGEIRYFHLYEGWLPMTSVVSHRLLPNSYK